MKRRVRQRHRTWPAEVGTTRSYRLHYFADDGIGQRETGGGALWQVRRDIDAGRLDLLLPHLEPPPIAVSAI
jgi:hypothetical protein